jgi:hydrogenase maturation protease
MSTDTPRLNANASPTPGAVIIGMGNILYHDEGVGVYGARALETCFRFSPEVEIVDGASLGFGVISYFAQPTSVIVLDAIAANAPTGTIFRLPADELCNLAADMRPTAHEVDPIQMLKMAPALGGEPDMVLIGIVPENTSELCVGLTPALAVQFERYVDAALAELRARGIEVDQVERVSIEKVIDSLASGVR